jgi:hypothetical protein
VDYRRPVVSISTSRLAANASADSASLTGSTTVRSDQYLQPEQTGLCDADPLRAHSPLHNQHVRREKGGVRRGNGGVEGRLILEQTTLRVGTPLATQTHGFSIFYSRNEPDKLV